MVVMDHGRLYGKGLGVDDLLTANNIAGWSDKTD